MTSSSFRTAIDPGDLACRDAQRLLRALAEGRTDARWQAQVEASRAWVVQRRARRPLLKYPDLPVVAARAEIIAALSQHQVLVLAGETGSGKTTQLPKLLLEAGLGARGLIAHTQPRRLAARQVAQRLAEELETRLGDQVGCKVRFSEQSSPDGYVKLMTDGILLAEMRSDRRLRQYEAIIIDEAHERSLNIDFLLGTLRLILPQRPDLKLVITSATIDVQRFAAFFGGAPVIEVGGRQHPVDTYYQPFASPDEAAEGLPAAVLKALHFCDAEARRRHWGPCDALVFASSEREIRELHAFLHKAEPGREILPLYARLSPAEQQRVFAAHTGQRVVLATNVAETSLTVPGIRFVIDPGQARISRYSHRSKVQRLPIEPIAQSSADQRRGRAGRLAPGLCVRLYSEEDLRTRPLFTDPEVLRTHLSAVILQMCDLKLGDASAFPWLDAPDERYVKDGYRVLEELGAWSAATSLTAIGRDLAAWPVDPRLGRMLIAAAAFDCLREVLIIVAALAIQDVRERPLAVAATADQRHALFRDESSDFLFFVRLWEAWQKVWESGGEGARRTFARQHFLSWLRLREWRELHRQLLLEAQQRGWRLNQEAASYESIHCALMLGLPAQIGRHQSGREVLMCRQQKAHLHPGSTLAKKPPPWVLAAEMQETGQVWLRHCARIDSAWIEKHLRHLLKFSHQQAHWSRRAGRALVMEQASLMGLVIYAERPVALAPIDAAAARDIFLLDGLVRADIFLQAPFLRANRALVADLEGIEEKARRRDILADELVQKDFYAARIPVEISDVRSFEAWRRQAEKEQPDLLFMSRDLLAPVEDGPAADDFPDLLSTPVGDLALHYEFAPGSAHDGVTLICPLGSYWSLDWAILEYLVPGLRQDLVLELLRTLPKELRRQLVPLPALAQSLSLPPPGRGLRRDLVDALSTTRGLKVDVGDFQCERLPVHLRMNVRVVDADGRILAQGRDRDELDGQLRELRPQPRAAQASADLCQRWQGEAMPEQEIVGEGALRQVVYPAWQDEGQGCRRVLCSHPLVAQAVHRRGCARLLALEASSALKPWRQKAARLPGLVAWAGAGSVADLADDFILAIVQHLAGLQEQALRSRADYQRALLQVQQGLHVLAEKMLQDLQALLAGLAEVRQRLATLGAALQPLAIDVEQQLAGLFPEHMLQDFGYRVWQHHARYLRAIVWRIERAGGQWDKDQQSTRELARRLQAWQEQRQRYWQRQMPVAALDEYRWLLEEYRVALFAQVLKTAQPVSAVRLDRLWQEILARA